MASRARATAAVTRRNFLGGSVGLLTIGCAGRPTATATATAPPATVRLGEHPELRRDGGFAVVQPANGETLLIRRQPDGSYRALSLRCTHAACTVRVEEPGGALVCPCHGSRFDDDGSPLEGPATLPLSPRRVERAGDRLRILPPGGAG